MSRRPYARTRRAQLRHEMNRYGLRIVSPAALALVCLDDRPTSLMSTIDTALARRLAELVADRQF